MKLCIWRIQAINQTKIRYILIADKTYKITDINFADLTIEAYETNMNAGDIPESEIFMVNELSGFGIKLHNQRGKAEVVDYGEWVKIHGSKD